MRRFCCHGTQGCYTSFGAEMTEITFIIHRAEEGGFWARAEGHSIFTQGETLDELEANIREAVALFTQVDIE